MEHEGPLPSGKRSPTGPAPPDPKWEPGLAGNPQPRKLLGGEAEEKRPPQVPPRSRSCFFLHVIPHVKPWGPMFPLLIMPVDISHIHTQAS